MFPGLDEMMKKAGDAKVTIDKNHAEQKKLLEEIRDVLKEMLKALKGE